MFVSPTLTTSAAPDQPGDASVLVSDAVFEILLSGFSLHTTH
jgi:hypothetical protein